MGWFRRIGVVVLVLAVNICYAGISGKILGRVVDSETNEPLVGVNIVIEGTTLGAASNAQGNFIITWQSFNQD